MDSKERKSFFLEENSRTFMTNDTTSKLGGIIGPPERGVWSLDNLSAVQEGQSYNRLSRENLGTR
jgi:hypothetical protein